MAEKIKVSEIRSKFPMYGDLSDDQLLSAVRRKYYSDIPMSKFSQRIDYDTERERLNKEQIADMGGVEKFVAGYGSAVPRLVRGIKQRFGGVSQEDVDEANRLDAPLLETGAGMAGNVFGNVAAAVPTVAIPGAATLPGAAIVGGAMGLAEPTSTGESALQNAAWGAAGGAGGVVAGRGAAALGKGGKALVEPFYEGGRQAIAGRTLQRFGVNASDVAQATGNPTITGARTTLAEQITRPEGAAGAARLQDATRALDPEISGRLAAREVENNAARVKTLRDLAGEGGERAFALANRTGTSGPIYDDAFKVDIKSRLTPQLEKKMQGLMMSPDIKKAAQEAQRDAINRGTNVASKRNAKGSVEGLHDMKMSLDGMIAEAKTAQKGARADALKALQKRLVGFIEEVSPEYKTARTVHAQMSKPINQMDVAGELLKRGSSATTDLAGNARLMPDALARASRDEGLLIKQATGRSVGNDFAGLMEPDQLAKIRGVTGETDRAAAIARAGNGPGSATAQRLASQNVLRQILGPTGLPQSWAESTLLNTAMRPVQFAYNNVAEPRIQSLLADLILDPSKASKALTKATPAERGILAKALENAYLQQAGRTSVPALSMAGER